MRGQELTHTPDRFCHAVVNKPHEGSGVALGVLGGVVPKSEQTP